VQEGEDSKPQWNQFITTADKDRVFLQKAPNGAGMLIQDDPVTAEQGLKEAMRCLAGVRYPYAALRPNDAPIQTEVLS